MAVHLRRLDYKYAHKENVPSIPHAAKQIKKALKTNQLDVVYISTDAPDDGTVPTARLSFTWWSVAGRVPAPLPRIGQH